MANKKIRQSQGDTGMQAVQAAFDNTQKTLGNPPGLQSLSVNNYRAFRRLEIKKLGRANLIVGKNNVGKTCLLEVLWLYASKGSPEVIRQILAARNELDTRASEESQVSAVKHLFYGRQVAGRGLETVSIQPDPAETLTLRLIALDRGIIERIEQVALLSSDPFGVSDLIDHLASRGLDTETQTSLESLIRTLSLQPSGEKGLILTVQWGQQFKIINENFKLISPGLQEIPAQFISSHGLDDIQVAQLWNQVYLTDLQDDVETALRLIEPDIKSVGLVKSLERDGPQVPQARMANGKGRVLLSSLGEGMNRIFGLTLALVNAKNGLVLVDEIGTGIHYSVQPGLWDFILALAFRLNVQVFATTHSWDAVEAFQQATQNHQEIDGMLISLRNKEDSPGEVVGTLFDEEDLAYITQEQIEVR